jgi:hypothetical protein
MPALDAILAIAHLSLLERVRDLRMGRKYRVMRAAEKQLTASKAYILEGDT